MAETSLPPGLRLPRALQTLGWFVRPMPLMERCRERYGDMFRLRIGQVEAVLVSDPELVKQVFKADPRIAHAGEGNAVLLPLVGHNSVLLLDEGRHLAQRKLLLPPFHGERMERYGHLMRDIAAAEVERWPRGEPMALWPRMQAITLEIIMRAVFGLSEGSRLEGLRGMLARLLDESTRWPSFAAVALLGPQRVHRWGLLRRELDPIDRLLIDEIRERRADPDVAERDDILSLLVQARHDDGTPMDDRELRDELMTLLAAGHETTATSLAWALERLARHPEKLSRLREEVRSGGEEYLDAVTKETLRLRPVLPLVARRLTEPFELGGYTLPPGTSVTPCIYLIHRREDIYPEPRRFRPERFIEQPAGTYTWIPFGGGVRRCVGASFALFEMRQVLATIVGRVELRANGQAERVRRRAITLTPERGAEMVIA